MLQHQETSVRQSLVCQICQIPFNKNDRIETLVCKNMHIICFICSKQIAKKNPTCPFCRQEFFDDVKKYLSHQNDINYQSQIDSIRISLIERPLIDQQASRDLQMRKKIKKIKIRIIFMIFFLILGVIGIIVNVKMNSCQFWGNYYDCPFEEIFCCTSALQCIIFHQQCPTLSHLQTPLIQIITIPTVFSYILWIGALTSLIKVCCKK